MGTTRAGKTAYLAEEIRNAEEELCTQCNHCVAACLTRRLHCKSRFPAGDGGTRQPVCIRWT